MSTQASATTPNYGLSQWAEGDRIWREDFNHDNAAIDAALHTQAAQTEAAVKAVEEQISLIKLVNHTLTAGSTGTSIDLSSIDLTQYAELILSFSVGRASSSGAPQIRVSINGNSASYLSPMAGYFSSQLGARMTLWSRSDAIYCDAEYVYLDTSSASGGQTRGKWDVAGFGALNSIQISYQNGTFAAGSSICLYGLKK